uniref:Neur_chan_LBD domain-containing protein n=1 Tax=Hydatigena taeniaeformis TaxID=6205 RepID=A0A0R3WJX5_HYDTA
LKSNVWLTMSWYDYRIAWNPSEFADIKSINIAAHKLWKPDIVVMNNVDGEFEAVWKPNTILHSDGRVLWIPPAIFKTACEIDVRYFPFDQQTCHMDLGSWTYTNKEVELQFYVNQTNIDLSDYVKSGMWDFVEGPVSSTHRRGSVSNRPTTARLTFKIVLRRKPLFYITNIIIPCVLISILGVCVFCLPADAGEKITLSISILVTLVVYMILVSKILPAGPKSIPLLSQFLLFTFAMTFLALCITAAVIINLNHCNPKSHPTVPLWVQRSCMDWLSPVLCLQRFDEIRIRYLRHPLSTGEVQMENESESETSALEDESTPSLNTIIKSVKRITKHVMAEEREKQVRENWKHVTSAIDRVQLIIFTCVTVSGTLIILFSAPYIFAEIDQASIIRKFSYNRRDLQ